MLKNLWN